MYKRQEEEIAKKKAEREAKKKAKEEEALRKKAEREARKKAKEQEALRKKLEREAKKSTKDEPDKQITNLKKQSQKIKSSGLDAASSRDQTGIDGSTKETDIEGSTKEIGKADSTKETCIQNRDEGIKTGAGVKSPPSKDVPDIENPKPLEPSLQKPETDGTIIKSSQQNLPRVTGFSTKSNARVDEPKSATKNPVESSDSKNANDEEALTPNEMSKYFSTFKNVASKNNDPDKKQGELTKKSNPAPQENESTTVDKTTKLDELKSKSAKDDMPLTCLLYTSRCV